MLGGKVGASVPNVVLAPMLNFDRVHTALLDASNLITSLCTKITQFIIILLSC